jgi:hypothetical protein
VRSRLLVGGVGMVAGLFGAYLLLTRQDVGQLRSAAFWLVSGVVLHDFVLAPAVLVVVALGGRWVPASFRAATTAGLVVLGTVTVLAIPVLGRFGERPDNHTLLNRHYTIGWLALAGLVLVTVAVGGLAHRRRHPARTPGSGPPP